METTNRCDVLLLAAFLPELAPLRALLGDAMRARVGAVDVAARVVGIGLPTAAVGAAMQVAELRPRAVVALGTCGAYLPSAGLSIGDVAAARRVRLVDAGVVSGGAQFPEPMSTAIDGHPGLTGELERAGATPVDVATTLAITVDDTTAGRIATAPGADVRVEHLEAFGMAAACAARGIPFAAVLGVANFVGARARGEWRTHHHRAEEAAVEVVVRWLRGGPILP